MGVNQYPHTVDETVNILNTYTKTTEGTQQFEPTLRGNEHQTEVVFPQANDNKKSDHMNITNITCYHCGQPGHYAKNCPVKTNYMSTIIGKANNEDDLECGTDKRIFYQMGNGYLNKDWVLLDNQSTLD